VTQRYKDWRIARKLTQLPPQEILPEEETVLSKECLISQLEVAKARLALMEEKEEAARTKIIILEDHCQKSIKK
jgi:hypothetical protein